MGDLLGLMALGAGMPNLGKFTGIDPVTGTFNFELERNLFYSNVTGKVYNSFDDSQGTYFKDGWVDEDEDWSVKLKNFFSGGKK